MVSGNSRTRWMHNKSLQTDRGRITVFRSSLVSRRPRLLSESFAGKNRRFNMTMALCLSCGSTKLGAFNPCSNCRAGPSGDKDLDILFSDHRMSARTIEQFGQVIRAIQGATADPEVRFWVF